MSVTPMDTDAKSTLKRSKSTWYPEFPKGTKNDPVIVEEIGETAPRDIEFHRLDTERKLNELWKNQLWIRNVLLEIRGMLEDLEFDPNFQDEAEEDEDADDEDDSQDARTFIVSTKKGGKEYKLF